MKPGSVGAASSIPAVFPIVAHQGGWDEILIVATPLALIATLLFIANRRVDAKLAERSDADSPSES